MVIIVRKTRGKRCPKCNTEMVALKINEKWLCPKCRHVEPLFTKIKG